MARCIVRGERRVLYVVAPGCSGLEEVQGWKVPRVKGAGMGEGWKGTGDVLGYLRAFYHGVEVFCLC